jgi:hypothetical protein
MLTKQGTDASRTGRRERTVGATMLRHTVHRMPQQEQQYRNSFRCPKYYENDRMSLVNLKN